ncbi:MAG: histidine phosphatase family protein [Chlamydiia bacterium]|nr:histidine phosphatase family protein [Chlamydiia bacterium]
MLQLPRKSFFFVRHGQTDVNADPHIKRVDYDLPLNAKGQQQALAARNVVQRLSFDKVKCSPIQRAQQTKQLMLEGMDLEHQDDDRLSECCAEIWNKMVRLEDDAEHEVCAGVLSFLDRVFEGVRSALAEEGQVLVVAHGGVHWAICYHLSIANHPWKIGNCEVVHFEPIGEVEWRATVLG